MSAIFGHEFGHFYWSQEIEPNQERLRRFREIFGDDREDYQASLDQHYSGHNERSPEHISVYATSHPWEDWAETFAHYLHMRDVLETAHEYGLAPRAVEPTFNFDYGVQEWRRLSVAFNEINRSMGLQDLYPFTISDAVEEKLRFIHEVVESPFRAWYQGFVSIQVALHHETVYRYDQPVSFTPHLVRLRPAPHCRTPILAYSLKVSPEDHFLNWQQDPYGNHIARFVFPTPSKELRVTVDLLADMTVINPFDFFVDDHAKTYPFSYGDVLERELGPYLSHPQPEAALSKLAEELREDGVGTVDYLVKINSALRDRVGYVIRMEPGVQTPEETLTKALGSCRDSAWLAVQLLRNLGLAARFVSGYLIQLKADQKSLDGPSGSETDFTDLPRLGRVLHPWGRDGSASTRLRDCWPGKGTSRWRPAPNR